MIKVDINRFKNKIFTAPAQLFLRYLKDNCVDLALIDPAYGIDYCGQLKKKLGGQKLSITKYHWNDYGAQDQTWDRERTSPDLIKEVIRVSKNQIIWGGNYFSDILKPTQCLLIWNKKQRGFSLADGEVAWTSYDKALRIFDYSRSEYKADEPNKIHPTQKPVKLFEFLTARSEKIRYNTRTRLNKEFKNVLDYCLLMRAKDDLDPAHIVKEKHLKTILERYEVILAIDDEQPNLDMFNRYGLLVKKV